MNEKIINVYFGVDCLPYKDKERSVHYPITQSAFLGASNTTKIRFYVDRLGNSSVTWVSVAKLPNGKQGSKVLSYVPAYGDVESYVELSLDQWYTQAKGDVYIALQGYQGGVQYSYDSESGLYTITGTPTIQTTGSIKLAINYAPIGDSPDYTDEFTTYQEILAALGDKIDVTDTIIAVSDISQLNPSNYEEGQVFYDKKTELLYRLDTGVFERYAPYIELMDSPINVVDFEKIDNHPEYPILYNGMAFFLQSGNQSLLLYTCHFVYDTEDKVVNDIATIKINRTDRTYQYNEHSIQSYTKSATDNLLSDKQDTLVSGENIKTINNLTLLGSGNIEIQGGSGGGAWGSITGDIQDQADLQAEFQNVREVAEGKCKSVALQFESVAPTTDQEAQALKKPDGTSFTSLAEFNSYVENLTIVNSNFNTQNGTIWFFSNNFYIITSGDGFVYTATYIRQNFKLGDLFLVNEINVPDRWLQITSNAIRFNKLETSKVDLDNYATKTELGEKADLDIIAPEYDDSIGYVIGDLRVYQGKLYRCTTSITTAESFDSSHWEEISVSSDFVNLTGTQTISGIKTFENGMKCQSFTGISGSSLMYLDANNRFVMTKSFIPSANGTIDFGSSSYKWRNLYLSGNISDGTNETSPLKINNNFAPTYDATSTYALGDIVIYQGALYQCSTAITTAEAWDSTHWTTISVSSGFAKENQGFNVIKVSEMTDSTHLTQAQFDLIGNGKPNRFNGTLFTYSNPLVLSLQSVGNYYYGMILGASGSGYHTIKLLRINTSNRTIELDNQYLIKLENILNLNGKDIVGYYLNNVYHYATLSGTELKYEEINNISISANTTFTLATAPNDTYPEYKANITNTDTSNAITITLPSGTVIKGNVTISSNTFEIPADSSVELSVQNQKAIVILW